MVVGRCFRTKRTDGAWREDGAVVFTCYFEHVPQTVDTDFPGQLRTTFCNDAQEGCEVVDGINVVFLDDFGNLCAVGHVNDFGRTALEKFALGSCTGNVSANNVVIAVNATQLHCQFRANLTGGSNYQDIFHFYVVR